MVKLNLGSGPGKPEGFLNLDISEEFSPDIICDLEHGLPFSDNSVDEIMASHTIEHLSDTIFIMNEIWRVCKDNAIVNIVVPHQASKMAFADPTHKKVFNEESFKYFCYNGDHYWIHKSYGIYCNFEMVSQKISRHERYGYVKVKLRAIKTPINANIIYAPPHRKRTAYQILTGVVHYLIRAVYQKFSNIKLVKKLIGER